MSTPSFTPKGSNPQGIDWAARMIPGIAVRISKGFKKQPQSVGRIPAAGEVPISPCAACKEPSPAKAIGLLLPTPLIRRSGATWLRSVATDFAFVGLSWMIVGTIVLWRIAGTSQIRSFGPQPGIPTSLIGMALLHAALITLLGYSEGLYSGSSSFPQQVRALGNSVVWATLLWSSAYYLQGVPFHLGITALGAGLVSFGALLSWRFEDLRRQRRSAQPRRDMRNTLIIGADGTGRRVASYLERHPDEGRVVCGILDDNEPIGNGVIGHVRDLPQLARAGFVDEVMLAAPHDRLLTQRVLREARRLRLDVEIVPDLFGCRPAEGEVDRVGNLPIIYLHEESLPAAGLLVKRAVDIVGAGAALILLAPLLVLIAALIKLGSKGPVIYAAQRAGRKGRPFRCCKFRTMVCNADDLKNNLRDQNQRSGPIFKIASDPRITRQGRLLRRYSLDELPQLWNVLKGEMSLVGPRPHPLDDYAAYEIEHLARLDVVPGMTGLWQITARRDPSFQRGVELDREYIRTWSLAMDMRILFRTVAAVVRGSGD